MRQLMQDLGDLSGLDIAGTGRESAWTTTGADIRLPGLAGVLRARLAVWVGPKAARRGSGAGPSPAEPEGLAAARRRAANAA